MTKKVQLQIALLWKSLGQTPRELPWLDYRGDAFDGFFYTLKYGEKFFRYNLDDESLRDPEVFGEWLNDNDVDIHRFRGSSGSDGYGYPEIRKSALAKIYRSSVDGDQVDTKNKTLNIFGVSFKEKSTFRDIATFMSANDFRFATMKEMLLIKDFLKKFKTGKSFWIVPNSIMDDVLFGKGRYIDFVIFRNQEENQSIEETIGYNANDFKLSTFPEFCEDLLQRPEERGCFLFVKNDKEDK